MDRRVVLFRLARQQPAAARAAHATRTKASAASCGPSTAAASTTCRSIASRRRELPPTLHWFKWEAYSTWLSGFALLVVMYWWHADIYMIDRSVAAITPLQAVALSAALLVGGWVVYDQLCKRLGFAHERAARRVVMVVFLAARRVGAVARVQRPRDVPADRRDARHDDGGERAVRHHPGAAQAGRGEGRSGERPTRSTACAASSARCTTTISRCRCC